MKSSKRSSRTWYSSKCVSEPSDYGFNYLDQEQLAVVTSLRLCGCWTWQQVERTRYGWDYFKSVPFRVDAELRDYKRNPHLKQEAVRKLLEGAAKMLLRLSQSNNHHILFSPFFIPASMTINTLVDERESNRLPQEAWGASPSPCCLYLERIN